MSLPPAGRKSSPPDVLTTERLSLIAVPVEFLDAVVAGAPEAAEAIAGARLPAGWPQDAGDRAGLAVHHAALSLAPEERLWRMRLIALSPERRVVGTVNVKGPPADDGSVDLGWSLERAERGHGFATEAARAVADWLAGQPGVRRITARIDDDNVPSIRVAERLGMQPTGMFHPAQGRIWELVPRR